MLRLGALNDPSMQGFEIMGVEFRIVIIVLVVITVVTVIVVMVVA